MGPQKSKQQFQETWCNLHRSTDSLEDDLTLLVEDDHHAEQRFVTLGLSESNCLLVVVYTYREDHIRIMSARKATAAEKAAYEE